MTSTSESEQHIAAGNNEMIRSTVSDDQVSNERPDLRLLSGDALIAELRIRLDLAEQKNQRVGTKAFAVFDHFKALGEQPDVWMDLFSEIVIAADQRFHPGEVDRIRRELPHLFIKAADVNGERADSI